MKTILKLAAGMVVLGAAAPAFAQNMSAGTSNVPTEPNSSTPWATGPATAGAVSDADVTKFAKAVVAIEAIQRDAAIPSEQKQAQMAAKVQEQGLAPEKFNEIAQVAQTDPAMQTKVQAAIQAQAGTR